MSNFRTRVKILNTKLTNNDPKSKETTLLVSGFCRKNDFFQYRIRQQIY